MALLEMAKNNLSKLDSNQALLAYLEGNALISGVISKR
jgi:hypothetical protein